MVVTGKLSNSDTKVTEAKVAKRQKPFHNYTKIFSDLKKQVEAFPEEVQKTALDFQAFCETQHKAEYEHAWKTSYQVALDDIQYGPTMMSVEVEIVAELEMINAYHDDVDVIRTLTLIYRCQYLQGQVVLRRETKTI